MPATISIVVEVVSASALFQVTFLISCISSSDVMGRKPKRLVYATEGLATQVTACEMTVKSLERTSPIGLSHALSLKKELIAIQVELQLNLVTMHVFTASFPEAEKVSVARLKDSSAADIQVIRLWTKSSVSYASMAYLRRMRPESACCKHNDTICSVGRNKLATAIELVNLSAIRDLRFIC
jgi:hypothetical protein